MSKLLPDVADLQLLGMSDLLFIKRGFRRVVFILFVGTVSCVVITLLLGQVSPILLVGMMIACALFSWTIPVSNIGKTASRKRADMDLAVAVYLDLVNVLLAGGCGVETAMLSAASTGDGWSFEQIRLALARAQSSRSSYWDSLRELGERTGVDALLEVANSVQLAGEHGARVRQSLTAKAHALRARNLARVEHEAEERTERMGIPIVLVFMGFILLIGYPAFVGTVGAL